MVPHMKHLDFSANLKLSNIKGHQGISGTYSRVLGSVHTGFRKKNLSGGPLKSFFTLPLLEFLTQNLWRHR